MENVNTNKKTNTQLLKEIQETADTMEKYKVDVEKMLDVIDSLERKYYELVEEVKQNSIKK